MENVLNCLDLYIALYTGLLLHKSSSNWIWGRQRPKSHYVSCIRPQELVYQKISDKQGKMVTN